MENVFRISPRIGPEDRFTAQLHYVMDCIPEIAQAWANHLLARAGKPQAKVVRVVDHPTYSLEDHPDFRFECETVDIICEHKLGSPLGPRQLERYLDLRGPKPAYLALISSGIVAVPDAVKESKSYLRPVDNGLVHYRWDELYPLIWERPERLARDFAEYMADLGMRPLAGGSWNDLFVSDERARAFEEQWTLVRSHFRQLGVTCKADQSGRGLQIQHPEPWAPLLHVAARQTVEPPEQAMPGPYLRASLYIYSSDPHRSAFGVPPRWLDFGGGPILSRPAQQVADWSPNRMRVRQYLTRLDHVLSSDAVAMRDRLQDFTVTVLDDATALRGGAGVQDSTAKNLTCGNNS